MSRQLGQTSSKRTETITEIVEEEYPSPPAHRTRLAANKHSATDKLTKTSDYSSEESLDRLKGHRKEIFQVHTTYYFHCKLSKYMTQSTYFASYVLV